MLSFNTGNQNEMGRYYVSSQPCRGGSTNKLHHKIFGEKQCFNFLLNGDKIYVSEQDFRIAILSKVMTFIYRKFFHPICVEHFHSFSGTLGPVDFSLSDRPRSFYKEFPCVTIFSALLADCPGYVIYKRCLAYFFLLHLWMGNMYWLS